MLVYRVFPYDAKAQPEKSGHPTYLHRPQGAGRWDNPDLYDTWYVGREPETAIAESFGNLAHWGESMFRFPSAPSTRRVLGVFSLPDDLQILDLDDPRNLTDLGIRPSQVVIRNKAYTQGRARQIWQQTTPSAERRWSAIGWWSFHAPHLRNLALMSSLSGPSPMTFVEAQPLTLTHPAVVECASLLHRVVDSRT
ncbi:RES family NAD+ phosphorylase [Pseudoclavibacter helvolus]|uniref:RES family NAD+ phosphorylase n=1 Tax=Pseudoclavibacter helvolus TaxID=255205 RepID=UPI003735AF8B